MSLNLLYSMKEGVVGLKRARWATTITISTVAITMALLGVFLLITINVQLIADSFRERVTLEAFLDDALADEDVQTVELNIRALEGVTETLFISKERAMEIYNEEFEGDPIEVVGYNPLPRSFQIKIDETFRDPQRLVDLAGRIESINGVWEVVYHDKLFQAVFRISRIVILVDVALFITVLLSAILLVANTLRLTIFSQRTTIEIMELVGATDRFIRRPYLIQGIFQGGIGGVIGSVVVWILVWGVKSQLPVHLQGTSYVIWFPLVLGLILGFSGARLGLKRFMRAA